ncbi:MAG: hypothetical protein AMXMBFR13_45100 [Phycisphaerae bacterium]|jgi:hypothetical protein
MIRSRVMTSALAAIVSLPLLMGQGCPAPVENDPIPNPGENPGNGQGGGQVLPAEPTTLLTTSVNFINTAGFSLFTFNPTSAGKLVTASVSGNATGSRLRVQVLDNNNNVVAQEFFPTTSTTTVSFTSTTTGQHRMFINEAGAPSSLYEIVAIQQP